MGILREARHKGTNGKPPTRFVLVLSPAGTVLVLVLESWKADLAGGLEYDSHSCAPCEELTGK